MPFTQPLSIHSKHQKCVTFTVPSVSEGVLSANLELKHRFTFESLARKSLISYIMSAPHQGRQSPEPERQAEEQVSAPESGKIDAASDTYAKKASEETKHEGLSSNPGGPLEGAAQEKTSKEGRGNI